MTNKKIEVINAGVGDIGIKEEMAILKESGLQLTPDIVVLSFYLNDSRPPWGFTGEVGHRGWLRSHSVLAEQLYKKLSFYKWVKDKGEDRFKWVYSINTLNWAKDPHAFKQFGDQAKYDWGSAWETDSWKTITPYLKELKALSLKHNFKVLIVTFPVVYQIAADIKENTPQLTMSELANNFNFHHLDPLPMLRLHRNQVLYFDQAHPNTLGNKLIGETISK